MKILKFKIFENQQDIPIQIEECKDIIETFNEIEAECQVTNYRVGYAAKVYGGSYDFYSKQESEDDKIGISFRLEINISSEEHKDSTTYLDKLSKLIDKSKYLSGKLKRYCGDITLNVVNKNCIAFLLVFENTDIESKNKAKINRVYKKITNSYNDYHDSKRIYFYYTDKMEDPNRKKLYELLMKNPNIKKDSDNRKIELRYSTSIQLEGDTIDISIGKFMYTTDDTTRALKANLSKEEIDLTMQIAKSKLIHKIDKDIEVTVKGQKLLAKVI